MKGRPAVTVVPQPEEASAVNPRFSVRIETLQDVAVAHCMGRLCFQGEDKLLWDLVRRYLNTGIDLVLDFRQLQNLDSAGIGELVLISMHARSLGREVSIVAANGRVIRILKLTNVASLFQFFGSIEDALTWYSEEAA